MKFYLLDVNTITALTQLNPITIQRAKSLQPDDEMITCFVVVGEWEYGIRNALGVKRQWEIREQGAKIFGSLFDIVESSQEINLTYGEISAELRREGAMIPQNDIWIVATARVVGATVVTSDKHFKRVENLSVVDWTAS